MTPSGIEPATFRFVVQHLNHRVPRQITPRAISLAESNTGKIHKLQFEVSTMTDLKNIGAISDNACTLLSQNTPLQMPLLSEVVMFLGSFVVLTSSG